MINSVVLGGNLTKDVDLRSTPSGANVATFDIAINDKNGDKEVTYYFTCVAWNKTAEYLANNAKKGSKVIVDGRLTQRSYTAKDGSNRVVTEVQVSTLDLLSKAPNKEENQVKEEKEPSGLSYNDDDLPF